MGKLRILVFFLILVVNALLCLMYLQPKRFLMLDMTAHLINRGAGSASKNNSDNKGPAPGGAFTKPPDEPRSPPRQQQVRAELVYPILNFSNASIRDSNSPPSPAKKAWPVVGARRRLTHPYQYSINQADLCLKSAGKKLFLLVAVCSAVRNFRERQAIRETWGSACTKTGNTGPVRIVFMLGLPKDEEVAEKVRQEADKYRDVVQENFLDSYQNLTHKSVMMLKWASTYCPNVQFVLKTDDDMYVNVANLARTANRLATKKNLMFGVLFRRAVPERNATAKWYVPPSQYPGRWFPDYLSGTAYAMTADVVAKLYDVSLKKPFLLMEDVFVTGICASYAGVKRISIKGFHHYKLPSSGCAFREAITGHHVNVSEMRKIWRELRNGSLPCWRLKPKKT